MSDAALTSSLWEPGDAPAREIGTVAAALRAAATAWPDRPALIDADAGPCHGPAVNPDTTD